MEFVFSEKNGFQRFYKFLLLKQKGYVNITQAKGIEYGILGLEGYVKYAFFCGDTNMYDVLIVGSSPGGIFSAYELLKHNPSLKIAIFEMGSSLEKRKCPIDGIKIKSCIHCKTCAIMNGFGGAGAFSDGKYNITNEFGGDLYRYVGKEKAIELMEYVD